MSNSILEALQSLNGRNVNEALDRDYVKDGLDFAFDILINMDKDECKHWYYDEYAFDKHDPEDEVEKVICFALKSKMHLDEDLEDDIDADRDDKVERAKARFDKVRDDADSDRDYKKEKAGLNEADKEAALSIEDAQKWVDYDMKRYGEISERTNDLIEKAGYQIVKDEYGDYEVIAADYENESLEEGLRIKANQMEEPFRGWYGDGKRNSYPFGIIYLSDNKPGEVQLGGFYKDKKEIKREVDQFKRIADNDSSKITDAVVIKLDEPDVIYTVMGDGNKFKTYITDKISPLAKDFKVKNF